MVCLGELATCAQGSERISTLLVRLAFLCVTVHGFRRYLSAFGPKLDPSFLKSPGAVRCAEPDLLICHHSFRFCFE